MLKPITIAATLGGQRASRSSARQAAPREGLEIVAGSPEVLYVKSEIGKREKAVKPAGAKPE